MAHALDFLYVCLLVAWSPVLLCKVRKYAAYRDGWREKLLGRAPRRIGNRPCLWFHAVSVGEVMLLRPIIRELSRRRPDWDVVISTTTPTGLGVARRVFPELVVFYAPFDFTWAVRRAMTRVRPTVLALVELELWPNWIAAARRAGASVAVVNGRLSARSHRGYRRLRKLLGPTLRGLDLVAVQTPEYADRFRDLGVPAHRIRLTGSVKYDGVELERTNFQTLALRRALNLATTDLVFVAGSTMEGEELAALQAYRQARARQARLRLVIVPRHADRFDKVAQMLLDHGERVQRRSDSARIEGDSQTPPVILVDTLGELGAVWGLADVAFVGGSLYPGRGGQNMIEPAAYGASVLFGPHTQNFRATVEQLLNRSAARVVDGADGLAEALSADLDDPESAANRGQAAREFVMAQQGATERTIVELDLLFEPFPVRERLACA